MLLDNYWKWKQMVETTPYAIANDLRDGLYDVNGNAANCLVNTNQTSSTMLTFAGNNRALVSNYRVHLGTGTTPPEKNNYCLENQITSLSNVTYSSNTRIDEQGKYIKNIIITGANNTDSDIEVNEWAEQ